MLLVDKCACKYLLGTINVDVNRYINLIYTH